MAFNLSRIFKGKAPAEGIVTDNVDPDELGVVGVDGKFGPETEPAGVSIDVWEHAASAPGGTAAANVIGLGEPPSTGGIDVPAATGRAEGWAGIGAEGINLGDPGTHLESENGGLDTAPEEPPFGDGLRSPAQYNPKEIGIDRALPEVDDEVLVQFSQAPGQPSGVHDIHMNQGAGPDAAQSNYASIEFASVKSQDARGDSINDQTPADWNERSAGPGEPGQGFMMQDGELYPRGFASQTQPHADGLVLESSGSGQGHNFVTETPVDADSYTATDDLWKFKSEGPGEGAGTDNANRTMDPNQPGEGFMMQDGELYPRGIKFDPIDLETRESAGAGNGLIGSPEFFDKIEGAQGPLKVEFGADRAGLLTEIGFPQAQDGSGTDNANRTMGPNHPGEGFMMQDGELYPRGLRDMEIQMATPIGGPVSGDSGGPMFRSSAVDPAPGGPDTPGYTATDDLWKYRGEGKAPTSTGDQPELQATAGEDSGRPHEAMTLNLRETALGGPDTTERFVLGLEGEMDGQMRTTNPEGNPGSSGPGQFRPNPAGDGTTQHFSAGQDVRMDSQFQAMPDLDASGNSIIDAADYTIWRDNLRGSNPPEGILPFIEQNNLVGGERFNASEDQLKTLIGNLRQQGLIDVSTGEVVWADAVGTQTQATDPELAALISWLRSAQPPGSALGDSFVAPGDVAAIKFEISGGTGDADMARSIGPGSPRVSEDIAEIVLNATGDSNASEAPFDRGYLPPAVAQVETAIPAFHSGDDGPSTFLDNLGEPGAPTTEEGMSLNFEEVKIVQADPAHQTDLDVDFDGLDSDVDVP